MYIKNKRGQSTVEYVLLMTAVVAVIIAFVSSKDTGLQKQLNATLNTVSGDIGSMGDQLTSSHNATLPSGSGTPTGYPVTVTQ
jgi:Flp pilus assembly pilin Flp